MAGGTSTVAMGSEGSGLDAWRRASPLVTRAAGEGKRCAPCASWSLVVGSDSTYVWRVARTEYYFCGGPFYFSRSAKFGVFSLTAFFETFQDDPVFGTRRKDTAST